MKTSIKKIKVDTHKNWRAYWWDGYETKEQSVCIMEFNPGVNFKHKHLLKEEWEIEIVLEGKGTYSGAINKTVKPGDVIDQRGVSEFITITNTGKKPLKILCINRPPWRPEHEIILTE